MGLNSSVFVAAMSYALAALLLPLALNFLCWLAARRWPRLLMSESQRLEIDHVARYQQGGDLKPYVPDWFEIPENEQDAFLREFKWFYEPTAETATTYEDFTMHKHQPVRGRYINIHPAGFRPVLNQGPWPPSSQFYNVFVFGGSTTLGLCQDSTTIPNFLQAELNRRRGISRPIRVYHFGRGAYQSTQERILFQQLLQLGVVPDMAVFFDGTNDFYFFEGSCALGGLLANAVAAYNRDYHDDNKNRRGASPKWQKLAEFVASLPLARAIDAVGTAIANRGVAPTQLQYRPLEVMPELLLMALRRYLANKQQIEAICRDRGIRPLFVWQPIPAYKYDLSYHKAMHPRYGLGGHENSGMGYQSMAKWLETNNPGNHFVYLADIQESEKKPLYIDSVHYTAGFNRVIARHISDAIFDRGFIPGKNLAPEASAQPAHQGAAG